jgi:hypothetical protein
MRIGLASGDVLLAQVGAPERVELLVGGATARRVMEIQRRAEPGAVVIGGATFQEIQPDARVVTLASGLYRVLEIDALDLPPPTEPIVWVPRRDRTWEMHALIARTPTRPVRSRACRPAPSGCGRSSASTVAPSTSSTCTPTATR